MYSDAVEVTNPLGAVKSSSKMMIYFSILNIPAQFRSKIESYFLVMAARYSVKEQYAGGS